ncbi:MAG TPA: pseudouridine synthase [Planctomycetaceae bacterium]
MADTPRPDDAPAEGVRLQKLLAAAGIDSRRKCEEYVVTGRVTVDGEVVTDPGRKVDPETHDVRLDGERLRPQKKRYYLLNKPPGYLCTNYDRAGRPKAVDLVPARDARLFTVGRLDEASQGLILVTNDGDLAQRLAHPRYQVPRVYRVQVAGIPTTETLAQLRKGVHFAEGRFGLKRTKRLKTHGQSAFLEVELTQGQNREIRRLFARVGHKVMWLQRVAFGPLRLGDLPPGRFRQLRPDEIKALHDFVREGAKREKAKRPGPSKRPAKAAAGQQPKGDRAGGRRILDLSGEGPKAPRKVAGVRGTKPPRKPRG